MTSIRLVRPSDRGLLYVVDEPGDRVLDVTIDGRRIWSFREQDTEVPVEEAAGPVPAGVARFQPWPPALRTHLHGRCRLGLRSAGDEDEGVEVETAFGGGTGPLRLADVHGRPLVVNKWGRLGHVLADAPPGLVERMLDHMDDIRAVLEGVLGPSVMVTGGTLLGPARSDGHLIPHDDDADLAYLSSAAVPADVARENFELGRILSEHGYEAIRLSAAHVQVHFDHEGVPDHYVDVFAGYHVGDTWYQHFPIRAEVPRDRLLPPRTILVEGRPEPAPRDVELVLGQLYGSGWRVPDPSFTFELPAAVADRIHGWFPDVHVDREAWEDVVLLGAGTDPAGEGPSGLAASVLRHSPPGQPVLDLGCGTGADALAMAAAGRRVHGVDFSRPAVAGARRAAGDLDATFEVVNLLDLRAVLRLGARLAATSLPWTVLGRRLLDALEPRGRDHAFRLCSMVLRGGGSAHLDLVTDPAYTGVPPYRRVALEHVLDQAARHGLVMVEAEERTEWMTWIDAPDPELVELTRMTFRRRRR